MRIKFKGKTIEVKNETTSRKNFNTQWNGYTIEVTPYETHYYSNGKQKLKYEAYCINPMGAWICDTITVNTITEGVQECFNNIAIDIDDLKANYEEIGECLKMVEMYI